MAGCAAVYPWSGSEGHPRRDVHWITKRHTQSEWRRRRLTYGLHRVRIWHERVYRIARFIVENLDGDPRNMWKRVPGGVEPIDHVRSVLHTMRFGPALSRMVVGALRDHGLVKGETAFKDDIYVRRGMRVLGLASSERSGDVLEAGVRLFGKNSWDVDLVFYRLGESGYTTRAQIERYYRERIIERRDKKVEQGWQLYRRGWLEVIRAASEKAAERIERKGWMIEPSHDRTSLGFLVTRDRGRFAGEFKKGYLQVWSGVMANVGEACIELWNQLDFDIESPLAQSLRFRERLREEGYACSYDDSDGWERHYKLLGRFPIRQRPRKVGRRVSNALARASERAVRMLTA